MYSEDYVNYVLRAQKEISIPCVAKKETRFGKNFLGITNLYNKIMNKDLSLVPVLIDR
jgi:hypothetical protein